MKTLLALVCLLATTFFAPAQNYYFVSTNGNDNNNGSSREPWRNIQYGLDQLKPGDFLYIKDGIYFEKLRLNTSGKKNQLITIKAYNKNAVIIDGNNFNDSAPLFGAHNKSFYRIEGIHFKNCYNLDGGGGIYIDGYGDTIQIADCKFSNIAISRDPNKKPNYNTNQPVISFMGTYAPQSIKNVLVTGVEIFNCQPGYSECLSISGNAEFFEFSNNHVHHNANIGIDAIGNYNYSPDPQYDQARNGVIANNYCHHNQSPYAAAAGIYIDGAKDIVIKNNILHDNNYGAEIGCEESGSASNIIFKNNIVYNNKIAGIALGGYSDETGGKVTNSKIINNTFFQNDTSNDGNGELFIAQLENSLISNNIFYVSDHNYLMSNYRQQNNLNITYNLIYNKDGKEHLESYWNGNDLYGFSEIKSGAGVNTNNYFDNPKFNNIADFDFSLTANSPAIDAGDPNYIPLPNEIDIDKQNRINNNRVDCGADEYYDGLNTIIHTAITAKIYPNPTTNYVILEGNFKNCNITLSSIDGKLIQHHKNISNIYKLNLKQQKSGIYFITIRDNEKHKTGSYKVVKK